MNISTSISRDIQRIGKEMVTIYVSLQKGMENILQGETIRANVNPEKQEAKTESCMKFSF